MNGQINEEKLGGLSRVGHTSVVYDSLRAYCIFNAEFDRKFLSVEENFALLTQF